MQDPSSSTRSNRENDIDGWPGFCSVHRLQQGIRPHRSSRAYMFEILSETDFPKHLVALLEALYMTSPLTLDETVAIVVHSRLREECAVHIILNLHITCDFTPFGLYT